MNAAPLPAALPTGFAFSAERGTAAAQPVVEMRALPGPRQGMRHRWAYGLGLLGGVLRRHGLRLGAAQAYAARFTLDDALRERWYEQFDTRPAVAGGADCPFLFAQGAGGLLFLRVFADLGVNLRHVHHVNNSVVHPLGQQAYLAAREQRLEVQVLRSVRVGRSRVLLVLGTTISDDAGAVVARVEDGFVVGELPGADAAQADADPASRRAVAWLGRRSREIGTGDPGSRGRTLYIGPDAAQRFASVAGEHNPLHRNRAGARLFGRSRPVVPGLYLRNVVARELAEWGLPVQRLSITFVAPVGPGQTLVLVQQDERFEVADARGRLVAFGRC